MKEKRKKVIINEVIINEEGKKNGEGKRVHQLSKYLFSYNRNSQITYDKETCANSEIFKRQGGCYLNKRRSLLSYFDFA